MSTEMEQTKILEHPDFTAVLHFLDWLGEHPDLQLAQWLRVREDGVTPRDTPLLVPQQTGSQNILYEYFGIDAKKLEEERRALLNAIRQSGGV